MRLRRWTILAGLVVSSLLTCPSRTSANPAPTDSAGIYGSWHWVETFSGYRAGAMVGTPGICGCERVLRLKTDGGYELVEQDSVNDYVISSGNFTVQSNAPGDKGSDGFATIWLTFDHWFPDVLSSQRIHFASADTMIMYAGSPATFVADAPRRRFARGETDLHNWTAAPRPRLTLHDRPHRSEYEQIPAETDSSYDVPPVPVTRVAVVPSDFAREARIEGDVLLHVLVRTNGEVGSVTVLKGVHGLNENAIDTVRKWKFTPATRGNKPVAAWIEVPLQYRLGPLRPPVLKQ